MGTPFDWKGFNTFILDTDANLTTAAKENIIYIFANKLYKCTSIHDFHFRLLKAYISSLGLPTAKSLWDTFVGQMTTVALINDVAKKLLICLEKNPGSVGNIYAAGATDINSVMDNATLPDYDTESAKHNGSVTTSLGVAEAAAPKFNWKGFNTFILDTSDAKLIIVAKIYIICIFANKLYNCTSIKDYHIRLLKEYVTKLGLSAPVNTLWTNFTGAVFANLTDIQEIAKKLLVLLSYNSAKISDAFDPTNATTNINTILEDDILFDYATEANKIKKIDNSISTVEGVADLFNWKVFTDIFTNVKAADARKYICEYFISELAAGKIKNANHYTDAFILLMYLIKANVKTDESSVKGLTTAVITDKSNTLINNIAKAIHILFVITDLEKNIGTATADSLKIFENELSGPAPPTAITFNKTKLPAGWKNYELLNVLSYDVSIIKDTAAPANNDTKYGNILTFLDTISTPSTAPAANFKPNIIALQNTSGLQASKTYSTTKSSITGKGYNVDTSAEAITFMHTDTNKTGSDNLTDTSSHVFYQYSFNDAKQYLIVNIISKCNDKGKQKKISTPAIIDDIYPNIHKQIKYEPKGLKCLLIISGKIDGTTLDKKLVNEMRFYKVTDYAKYNANPISDIHIYTANFKGPHLFDIHYIDAKLKDSSNYSTSVPFGLRLFLSTDSKPIGKSKPKHTGPINMQNMHKVLSAELNGMDIGALKKLLASISPPNYGDKKKKTSSKTPGKATPVAATPVAATPVAATPAAATPVGKKINMVNIKVIDFKDAQSKGMIKLSGFSSTVDGKYKKLKFKTTKGEFYKTVKVISNEGTDTNAEVYKVDKEETYCIMVKFIGTVTHAVHDILIKGDKVFYSDTSTPKAHSDIDITAHVKT